MARYQYKREALTQDEATRLANACEDGRERLVIWTMLDTGMRLGEFLGLTRNSIDWQVHRLTVYGKSGPYGSSSKKRVLPMTTRVQTLLEAFFAINDAVGMSRRTVARVVDRVANKAHISRRVTPHVLRHTFSITALQKGISTRALQDLLGHDHLATTEIYLNISPEQVHAEFHAKW